MLFRLTCIVHPRDIMNSGSGNGTPLLSVFSEALQKASAFPIRVEKQTYNTVSFLVECDKEPDLAPFTEAAKQVSSKFDAKEADLVFSEVEEEPEKTASAPSEEAAKAPETEPAPAGKPESREPQNDSDPYADIMGLVGMQEIKDWATKINDIRSDGIKENARVAAITGTSYLLAIDPGNGCSSVLDKMSRLLASKLGRKAEHQEFTPVMNEARPWEDFDSIVKKLSYMRGEKSLTVCGIHLDSFLPSLSSDKFTSLLRQIKKVKNQVVVFIVPYLEDHVLKSAWGNIDDVITCRLLRVPPYGEDEFLALFNKFFSEYEMSLSDDCRDPLLRKISLEKSDGRFYGIETVRKICDEILYEKILTASDPGVITAKDVLAVLPQETEDDELSGEEQLDRLIALGEVKDRVKEICATIAWEKRHNENSHRSMHMMFSGAPGTGKTAVARIVGKMLKEAGILERGEFFEVSRKDLVGCFVGHTAPKTAAACRMAYGSVLFIDEAYSLAGGSENDYGHEAISTLIAEMENNRSRLIVIFAGYEDDLKKLFHLNSGLEDRIPYRLHFPNYSREELKKIFFSMLPETLPYEEDFSARVSEYFLGLPEEILEDENFSNARFVRNIVERVISKATLRFAADEKVAKSLLASDFELAIADAEFKNLSKKRHSPQIGF